MLYLKKYFTEGLIQFTILLSLIGVRVDVDTYLSNQLPPLSEIILGPSSAYTQTQFHNLRNTLDGYGIHPKSVDLDLFFDSRRLLNQVRQLDRLSVPTTELNTWLVHRDAETVVSTSSQSGPSITLDNGAGLEDVSTTDATLAMRGGSGAPESTYNLNATDSSLGAVAPEGNQEQGSRDGGDDLTKEVRSHVRARVGSVWGKKTRTSHAAFSLLGFSHGVTVTREGGVESDGEQEVEIELERVEVSNSNYIWATEQLRNPPKSVLQHMYR